MGETVPPRPSNRAAPRETPPHTDERHQQWLSDCFRGQANRSENDTVCGRAVAPPTLCACRPAFPPGLLGPVSGGQPKSCVLLRVKGPSAKCRRRDADTLSDSMLERPLRRNFPGLSGLLLINQVGRAHLPDSCRLIETRLPTCLFQEGRLKISPEGVVDQREGFLEKP